MESVLKVFPELSKIHELSTFQSQIKQLQISIRDKNQNDLKNIRELASIYLYGASRLNQKIKALQQKEKNCPSNQNSYRLLSQNILQEDIFIKRGSANYYWCRCKENPTFYFSQQEYLCHLASHPQKNYIQNLQNVLKDSSHLYIFKKLHQNPFFNMDYLQRLFIISQLDFSKFYLCLCNDSNKYYADFSERQFKKHIENEHSTHKPYITTHNLVGQNLQIKKPRQMHLFLQNKALKSAIQAKTKQIIEKMIKTNQMKNINFAHLIRNDKVPLHKCIKIKQNLRQIKSLKQSRKNIYCQRCNTFVSFPYSNHQHQLQQKSLNFHQLKELWWKQIQNRTFYLCGCNNYVVFSSNSYLYHLRVWHNNQAPPYSSHILQNDQLKPNPSYSKQQLIKDLQVGMGLICGFCPQKIVWKSNCYYINHIFNQHDSFHPYSSHTMAGLRDILFHSIKGKQN